MSDWSVKTIGDVLTLSYGKPLDAADRDDSGTVPVYGANGVKSFSNRSLVKGPSIIVGRKGSAGELNYCEGPFWPLDVTYFVEYDTSTSDLRFLYYLLSLMNLPSLAKGVKPGINRNDVYALVAAIPLIEEQQRIVALLDAATARVTELSACYEQARILANNIFTSAVCDAFEGDADWPLVALGNLCEVLDSLRKPVTKRDRTSGEVPYYGATGIVDYVDEHLFDERLVLVGEDGAKWGSGDRSAFIIDGKTWVNNHAHVLRPNRKKVLDEWITHYLVHADLNEYVTGLTVPKLNQASLRSIEIPVPPIDEQQRIVARLDSLCAKTTEMVAAYNLKLQAAKELLRSVLEAAFRGEL